MSYATSAADIPFLIAPLNGRRREMAILRSVGASPTVRDPDQNLIEIANKIGVGFAPCNSNDRDKLVKLMEGVEDIPSPVMHEGLNWNWETFPEYLDALEMNKRDIDVCTLIPHAALRVYVMGDRALAHEKATDDDMVKMRKISFEAIKAGAFGFSPFIRQYRIADMRWFDEKMPYKNVHAWLIEQ